MKLLIYVVAGIVVLGAALVLIAGNSPPASSPFILSAFITLFAIPPFGAFWMMYQSIRYEKKPLRFVLLAFVPFAFVWYYFERVRSLPSSTRK